MSYPPNLPYIELGPLYPYKIFVCFSKTYWPEITPDFQIVWPIKDECGLCYPFHHGDLCIIADEDRSTGVSDLIDTIAHEAYHAAVAVNTTIGEHTPSEEIMARLVGIITGFCTAELLKRSGVQDENIKT